MKPDKVCMFLFYFLALTGINQQKRVGYVIRAYCLNAKQQIWQGRGPSNINLGIFVCSFDVCRAS